MTIMVGGLMLLDSVAQPCNGEHLDQRFLGLSYLWLADVGCSFLGYAKQRGSKELKICLLGICLKQLDV